MRLDEIDKKIISSLQDNGRMSLKEISRIVGLTSMGVKKRLEKLFSRGLVKVSALLNIESLNLYAALLFVELENTDVKEEILKRFRECPRVVYIFNTLSGYNFIVLTIAEDKETLESEAMQRCSLRSQKGIRRSEFYLIGSIEYEPFLPVRENLTHKGKVIAPCGVDCGKCERYRAEKCTACPATKYYRGPL